MQKVQKEFFMGNGVTIKDQAKAINDLINRDHPRLIRFLEEYGPGKLGTYFVPPIFFSSTPDIIKLSEYDAKTRGKGKHKEGAVRGQLAEQIMFNALKVYYRKRKDDVIILHSHKFLKNATEKDFIVFNVTKGYIMIIEVKASSSLFQKAKKQMFDSKEKIEEICGILGPSTQWLFLGVFFALEDNLEKPLFDCSCPLPCDTFAIIGRENIENKLRRIDLIAIQTRANKFALSEPNPQLVELSKIDKLDNQQNKNWIPSEHISEFVELAKQLMFVVQGDSKAPVTGCNLVKKIGDHVNAASTFEGIMFWTLEQLSVTTAVHLPYIFLDAFYSCGKSFTLQFISNHWSNEIGKGFEIYVPSKIFG